jgi:hypothetical protein
MFKCIKIKNALMSRFSQLDELHHTVVRNTFKCRECKVKFPK